MKTNLIENASDNEVLQLVLKGDTPLFEVLIRRHNPILYKAGRAFGFTHQDVQDLMQETYIMAFQHLRQFEGRSTFRTWLMSIMLNNCRQHLQRQSYRKEIPTDDVSRSSAAAQYSARETSRAILNKELSNVLERAISKLPPDYRMVFALRELSGLSVAETATALAISEVNVKVRLYRARTMLRKQLEQFYSPEDIFEFKLIYCDQIVEVVMGRLRELSN